MGTGNDQMLEMFLFEMSSLLDRLDEILLNSEKNQELTEEDVDEIFRIMHTIKGSSAMMEFDVVSTVTHRLEDTFSYIRQNGVDDRHFTELFDLMLEASDFLRSQLEAIQNGDELAAGNDVLVTRAVALLDALSGKAEPAPAPPAPEPPAASPAPAPEPVAVAEAPPAAPSTGNAQGWKVEVLFEEDCGMENLRAFMLVNTLRASCNILRFEPEDIETNPESASSILVNGFTIYLESARSESELEETVRGSMHVKTAHLARWDPAITVDSAPITGNRYLAVINFEEDCGMENLRAFMLTNTLRSQCSILDMDPADIESNPSTATLIKVNGFQLTLETPLEKDALQRLLEGSMYVRTVRLNNLTARERLVSTPTPAAPEEAAPAPQSQPAAAPPAAPATEAAAPDAPAPQPEAPSPAESAPVPAAKEAAPAAQKTPAHNKAVKPNLINVSLSKLDELMDLMGELVITESMVTRSPDLRDIAKLDNFNKAARQLRKLTDEMQDMVMSIRMVPVAGTFQKMQRIVRDMCRNLGKEANLVTMGEETDIDKTIIDGIADPIMHLVRNAMDHGVEMPDERARAGKNRQATVTLSAQNTGGEILITVSDDGHGLDAEVLLEKAKEKNILTKPTAEYTDKEAYMLLCHPGFSTKEKVTEYSGRGVGLDVVKKNVEKVGGTLVIESKKGYGTSFFLKIPLTLAIVDGMDISVGGGIYTLQITSINESFNATRDQVFTDTDGNEMIMLRGNVYPVVRLYELYDVPDAITDIEEGILIWVQSSGKSICLFADQLIGEQQIVVKPLPIYLNRYDVKSWGISGCTILGDGNISLILDVGSLIEKVTEKR